jgi:hypothetical protein
MLQKKEIVNIIKAYNDWRHNGNLFYFPNEDINFLITVFLYKVCVDIIYQSCTSIIIKAYLIQAGIFSENLIQKIQYSKVLGTIL